MNDFIELQRGGEDNNTFYINTNYGKMILDTGCVCTSVCESELTAGLKIDGHKRSFGILHWKKVKKAVLPSIEFGSCKIDNMKVTITDSTAEALLGIDSLGRCNISLNLSKNILNMIQTNISYRFSMKKGYKGWKLLQIRLGGKAYWGLLDTGASATVVDKRLIKKYPHYFEYLRDEKLNDSSGSTGIGRMYHMKEFSIAENPFRKHEIVEFNLFFLKILNRKNISFIIGATTLEQYIWNFNFTNNTYDMKEN